MNDAPAAVRIARADLEDEKDGAALLAMMESFALDPMGLGKPLPRETRERALPALRAHPTTRIWLAWDGAEPVGMLIGFVGFSSFRAMQLLNVHDLAVVPERRGQRIGEQLLAAAEAYGREQGFCKMTLEVQEENDRGRALYRRFGFGYYAAGKAQSPTLFLEKPLA